MDRVNKNNQLLNSPFELALRILFIMSQNENKEFDINALAYYDYIVTRLNDFNKNHKSLHNESPYKFGEIIAKKHIIKKSIKILLKKDLIEIVYTKEGIKYKVNPYSKNIISLFNSTYSKELLENIKHSNEYIAYLDFKNFNLDEEEIISKLLVKFSNESMLRSGIDEI